MSESRVHPVISRYSFVREVTRLRRNRARSLFLFLSPAREKSENREREEGGHERSEISWKTPRLKVVATRWCATTTSSKEREGAVIPREGIPR